MFDKAKGIYNKIMKLALKYFLTFSKPWKNRTFQFGKGFKNVPCVILKEPQQTWYFVADKQTYM